LKKAKESANLWKSTEDKLHKELKLNNAWAINRLKTAKPPR
jgi:hypothetical protein